MAISKRLYLRNIFDCSERWLKMARNLSIFEIGGRFALLSEINFKLVYLVISNQWDFPFDIERTSRLSLIAWWVPFLGVTSFHNP